MFTLKPAKRKRLCLVLCDFERNGTKKHRYHATNGTKNTAARKANVSPTQLIVCTTSAIID